MSSDSPAIQPRCSTFGDVSIVPVSGSSVLRAARGQDVVCAGARRGARAQQAPRRAARLSAGTRARVHARSVVGEASKRAGRAAGERAAASLAEHGGRERLAGRRARA